jgi:DNA-binding NarL/FixJ family response regulator
VVLHLAAQGLSFAEMAQRFAVSPRTAESHRTNTLRKLDLKDRTELVRYTLSPDSCRRGKPARPVPTHQAWLGLRRSGVPR